MKPRTFKVCREKVFIGAGGSRVWKSPAIKRGGYQHLVLRCENVSSMHFASSPSGYGSAPSRIQVSVYGAHSNNANTEWTEVSGVGIEMDGDRQMDDIEISDDQLMPYFRVHITLLAAGYLGSYGNTVTVFGTLYENEPSN